MNLPFEKLVGAGNDFVFISPDLNIPIKDLPGLTRKLCDRHNGIGADGLVLMEKQEGGLFRWHFYNSDGSSAEMCGNAARCSFLYIQRNFGLHQTEMDTLCGRVRGRITGPEEVEVAWSLESSQISQKMIQLPDGKEVSGFFINTGVPHFVIFNNDTFSKEDLREIQKHTEFGEAETNVTMLQALDGGRNLTRTFERGVRDFTLACGTGVIASAFVLEHQKKEEKYQLRAPGGVLEVKLNGREVFLKGPAQYVFHGEVSLP